MTVFPHCVQIHKVNENKMSIPKSGPASNLMHSSKYYNLWMKSPFKLPASEYTGPRSNYRSFLINEAIIIFYSLSTLFDTWCLPLWASWCLPLWASWCLPLWARAAYTGIVSSFHFKRETIPEASPCLNGDCSKYYGRLFKFLRKISWCLQNTLSW